MQKKIFVFDLDFTIWNAGDTWCDATHPPYYKQNREIFDQSGRWIRLYPDSKNILKRLKQSGLATAVASRTYQPEWANQLLRLFDIDYLFDFKQIYPSSKIRHFTALCRETGIKYSDMVFFDDEYRNIEEVKGLGVSCVLVGSGIDSALVEPFI